MTDQPSEPPSVTYRIWKYTLELTYEQVITLPCCRKILCVKNQADQICVWVAVDPNSERIPVKFYVVGTGGAFPDYRRCLYRDTVIIGSFVWHVFETIATRKNDDR